MATILVYWTDEMKALIKRLCGEGFSGGQIAAQVSVQLGRPVTRNAVIGVIHRNGWTLGTRATKPAAKMQARPKAAPQRPAPRATPNPTRNGKVAAHGLPRATEALFLSEPLPDIDDVEIPISERKAILRRNANGDIEADDRLTDRCCRWPIGDPKHADFHFCGKEKIEGLSFCAHHAHRAYQPPQQRARVDARIINPAVKIRETV